ncbi:MAG: YfhO family protein [Oscillospiraceae bacterium]|nr:YfhO family protein [Oscillospiraceae bacterium]
MSKNNKKLKNTAQKRPSGAFSRFLTKKSNILDPDPNKKQFNYCILGFLIPFLLTGLTLLVRAIAYEAGSSQVFSLLYSDAYYQYFPFFVDLRESILSGEGLLYSWNMGMGTDYLGLYAYYLGSPLNWLTVLIPETWMLDFYTFLVPVRLGLAGLFFSIFLKHTFRRNDISIALFGAFYATCAWAVGYLWNVMWLDTFALLPLVVLGTVRLLKDRKFILYTISLFFAIAINYYIGFFVCIFTLLVFICYEICRWKGFKRFCIDLCLMALFSAIAIGMTAVITLPAYASLQTTSSAANEFPKWNAMWITEDSSFGSFIKAVTKVATNTYASVEPNHKDSATKGGLPNLYCGVFAVVLSILFLTTKQVKMRDRICAALMLLFLNFSFIFKVLDYIWHGFHFTNEIPNRFSFLYSFVMLYMAYRSWLLRRHIRLWQVIVTGVITIAGMLLSPGFNAFVDTLTSEGFSASQKMIFPLVNGALILLYLGFLAVIALRSRSAKHQKWSQKRLWYSGRKLRRAIGTLGLIAVISLELLYNIFCFASDVTVQNLASYPRGGENSAKMIQYAKDQEDENSFYRMEVAQHQTYNDGALNGFYGITTFSSAANVDVTNYLRAMGLSGYKTYNRIAYYETSPVSNLFLNVKYILERQNYVENNPYFTDIQSSGKVHLLKNNYYLPIGFMVDPAFADVLLDENGEVTGSGTFADQNKLLSAALGREVAPFTQLPSDLLNISSNSHVTLSDENGTSCSYNSTSKEGRVFYNFRIDREGLLCIRHNMPGKNKFTVSYKAADGDFVKLHDDTHNGLAYISSICQVYPGDEIQVTIECKANESKKLGLTAAVLNADVMQGAYNELSQCVLNVTNFDQTVIMGNIDCPQSGLMYTSIPLSGGNWHVYVDGQEADITPVGNAMVGVMLEEGSHEITFRYQNKALAIGAGVSIGCTLLLIGIVAMVYFVRKKDNGKYAKETA